MLVLIILVSVVLFFSLLFFTKEICFSTKGTDSQKQVYSASKFNEWKFISGMHKFGNFYLKDVSMLFLVFFQKILKDYKSFLPVVTTSSLGNSVSLIFIFLNVSYYWNVEIGLIISFIYISCIWPYIIILYGGYHTVAQMFLLISIYFLNLKSEILFFVIISIFLSGIFFGLMFFSSSSSRKFLPLLFLAFVYNYRDTTDFLWFYNNYELISFDIKIVLININILILLTFNILKKYIKNNILLDYNKYRYLINNFQTIILVFIVTLIIFQDEAIYIDMLIFLMGFITVFLLLVFPNYKKNLRGYFSYLTTKDWASHHYIHENYYKKKMGYVPENSGGGTKWDVLFIFRTLPFHSILYILSIFSILIFSIHNQNSNNEIFTNLIIFLFGLSGIFWGRLTKGPQSLPAYFPVLLGILLQISQGIYITQQSFISENFFILFFTTFCIISFIFNFYILFNDILPSKLGVSKLIKFLKDNKVNSFYTYDTPFNNGIVEVIKNEFKNEFVINYIENIHDLNNGVLIVPPLSKQNVAFFESVKENFDKDQIITKLIMTKNIEKFTIKKFKTLGSSKYWLHIMDDLSYRDILFGDINDQDRYLSSCWVVNISNIRK